MSQYFAGNPKDKFEQLNTSEVLQDENQVFDDPIFPDVTNINEIVEMVNVPEEMECEDVRNNEKLDGSSGGMEIPLDEPVPGLIQKQRPIAIPCRSIRIGSYKTYSLNNSPYLNLSTNAISFCFDTPNDSGSSSLLSLCLRSQDITKIYVYFKSCHPLMFICTTEEFAEEIRGIFNVESPEESFLNPLSGDEKIRKITILFGSITNELSNLFVSCFPGDKVEEMNKYEANEMLLKSILHQNHVPLLQMAKKNPASVSKTSTLLKQMPAENVLNQLQVIRLFTYPPPPQSQGISITTNDLFCLNDRTYLNDAIIDFYLKYIFNEKLTPSQREKTHIFSTFFYCRLNPGGKQPRPGEETTENERAHNRVKNWTRNLDIFSKDFVIIPVNENKHWFLAIICFPGKVPDVIESTPESKVESNKSSYFTLPQKRDGINITIKKLRIESEGNNINQDENSSCSTNSTYLVPEPHVSDKPSGTSDSTIPHNGKNRGKRPCIYIFDSLRHRKRSPISASLRGYLEMEWKAKRGGDAIFDTNTMPEFVMNCPQQNNDSDCGLYLLQFVESFFEKPILYFGNPEPDLKSWFTEKETTKKRHDLRSIIAYLHQEQVQELLE